jgi:hypothetical protein
MEQGSSLSITAAMCTKVQVGHHVSGTTEKSSSVSLKQRAVSCCHDMSPRTVDWRRCWSGVSPKSPLPRDCWSALSCWSSTSISRQFARRDSCCSHLCQFSAVGIVESVVVKQRHNVATEIWPVYTERYGQHGDKDSGKSERTQKECQYQCEDGSSCVQDYFTKCCGHTCVLIRKFR